MEPGEFGRSERGPAAAFGTRRAPSQREQKENLDAIAEMFTGHPINFCFVFDSERAYFSGNGMKTPDQHTQIAPMNACYDHLASKAAEHPNMSLVRADAPFGDKQAAAEAICGMLIKHGAPNGDAMRAAASERPFDACSKYTSSY